MIQGYETPDLSGRREGGVWNAYIQVSGLQCHAEQTTAVAP